jgi:hypothetical protein
MLRVEYVLLYLYELKDYMGSRRAKKLVWRQGADANGALV